jgi:hypothetical protein
MHNSQLLSVPLHPRVHGQKDMFDRFYVSP